MSDLDEKLQELLKSYGLYCNSVGNWFTKRLPEARHNWIVSEVNGDTKSIYIVDKIYLKNNEIFFGDYCVRLKKINAIKNKLGQLFKDIQQIKVEQKINEIKKDFNYGYIGTKSKDI